MIIFFSAIVSVSNLAIGFFLFIYGSYSKPRQLFGLIMFLIGMWGIVLTIGAVLSDPNSILGAARVALLTILFVPTLFLLFTYYFPGKKAVPKLRFQLALFLPPLILLPFAFGEKNAPGFVGSDISISDVAVGEVYFFFIPYFSLYFVIAAIRLFRAVRNNEGIKKIQLKYILVSLSLAALFGILNNGVLPALFSINTNPLYPVVGSSIFTLATSYAITRYRFFDISLWISRRSLVVLAKILIFSFAAEISVFLLSTFGVATQGPAMAVLFLGIFFLLASNLAEVIAKTVSKKLPANILAFGDEIFPVQNLESGQYFLKLSSDITKLVREVVPEAAVSIFVYLRPEEKWLSFEPGKYQVTSLNRDNSLPVVLKKMNELLIRDEVELEEWRFVDRFFSQSDRLELVNEMKRNYVDIAIPLTWYNKEVHGFIAVSMHKDPNKVLRFQSIERLRKVGEFASIWFGQVLSYHYALRSAHAASAKEQLGR